MTDSSPVGTVMIIAAVLLFFGLGIAIMVIMDHKSRLPGGFTENPFSVVGMRRDHPVIAFLTTTILFGIIAALLLSLLAALTGKFNLFARPAAPGLLSRLSEERTAERLRHFHNLPPQDRTVLGRKNVCFLCHGDYPHSKEPMVRTLLNMHTQFIGCMTCHADERKAPEATLVFNWLNYSGIAVKGRPFGTEVESDTGYPVETDDWYSKIVVYRKADGAETLIEITADDPQAREFAAIPTKISDHDREALKKQFHKLVGQKGRFCSRCHTEEAKSYLPLRRLGFSDRRIHDLTNLNIVGLVQKYREFYMPTLLRSDKDLPPADVLLGPKSAPAGGIRKDPRGWWSQTYDAPKDKAAPAE
jgi:hypothetical protein